MFYRRSDSVYANYHSYERVIYNRADKTIQSEFVLPPTGEVDKVYEKSVLEATDDEKTLQNHYLYDHQGMKTMKFDKFKLGVEKVLKAIKFSQFDQQ